MGRTMIHRQIAEHKTELDDTIMAGTINLVYDHSVRGLKEKLTHLQHHHPNLVRSTLHIHIDHDNCLEVKVIRGRADEVRGFADEMISMKGIKYGTLVRATAGGDL